MSENQADRSAQQFEQSTPKHDDRGPKPARVHEQFKPVGISAVSAAAQFTSKAKKKTTQMA